MRRCWSKVVRRMAAERRIPFEVSVPEPDKKAMFIEAADKASAWARENGLTEDDLANELKALRAERNA